MTLDSLAEAAGVSASYLSEVERGIKRPSTDVVARVAEAFGMRPSEFLERVEAQGIADVVASPAFHMDSPRVRGMRAARMLESAMLASPGLTKAELLRALGSAAERLTEEELQILLELARRLSGKSR